MHSTHNQKGLPWMSHWQTTIGSPNTAGSIGGRTEEPGVTKQI